MRSFREKECNEEKKARMLIEEPHHSCLLVRWSQDDPHKTNLVHRVKEKEETSN